MAEETLPEAVVHPDSKSVKTSGKSENLSDLPFNYFSRKLFNILVLVAGDMAALAIGLAVAGFLRYSLKGGSMIPEWWWAVLLGWPLFGMVIGLLPGWGLGIVEEFRRTVLLLIGVFATVAIGLFLGKVGGQISRLTLTTTFGLGIPLLLYFRMLSKRFLIGIGKWGLPVVVYGGARTGTLAIQALRSERGLGYDPIGIFEDDVQSEDGTIAGVPILGGIQDTTQAAPVAVLAMSDLSNQPILELLDGPLSSYRHVVIIPELHEAPSLWVESRDLGGILGLEVTHNLLNPLARLSKRAFDLSAILVSAPIWLPLCLLISACIWLEDQGNPFFSQERIGQKGKSFRAFKFRTMLPNAENILHQRLEQDHELKAEWEANFKLIKDPRITRMGRFLRNTSLDELPQLINVLAGSMSLVGPRPLPEYHLEQLPSTVQNMRIRVRPGITGLWQVSGRSDAGTEGMIRYDPYYVRNWSIWLDIVILVRTLRAVIKRHGAY